jgi:hypothetical protein
MTSVTQPPSALCAEDPGVSQWQRSAEHPAQNLSPLNEWPLTLTGVRHESVSAVRQGASPVTFVHQDLAAV